MFEQIILHALDNAIRNLPFTTASSTTPHEEAVTTAYYRETGKIEFLEPTVRMLTATHA